MDSLVPLAPLDLVDVLEKLVLLCVTLPGLLFCFTCICLADHTTFLYTVSLRVLLVTLDPQVLLAPLARELTYLPSLVWVKLRSPPIHSDT